MSLGFKQKEREKKSLKLSSTLLLFFKAEASTDADFRGRAWDHGSLPPSKAAAKKKDSDVARNRRVYSAGEYASGKANKAPEKKGRRASTDSAKGLPSGKAAREAKKKSK